MIEYREKFPKDRKWKTLHQVVTLDQIRWVDYDHRINGKIFSGDLTDEFVELFHKEMFWMKLQGYE